MKNLETCARFADPEEHAVVFLSAVKGCAIEKSIIGLHKATRGVVAVQEPAGALRESKELGELPRSGQLEECAALGIGDALIGNLRRSIKISVGGLKDDIGPRALRTRVAMGATSTGKSKQLIDGSRTLCAGGYSQRQTENEGCN